MTATESSPILSASGLADYFGSNTRVIARQCSGLTHAESLLQPPMRGNCLNWVLGHIAVHRDYILEALGEEKVLGEGPVARYDFGSEPILGEEEGVLPFEMLLAALEESNERIAAALSRATPESLAQEAPGSGPRTIGQQVFFLYWHDTYHTGQAEYLRQLAGTDDKVI